MQKTKILPLLAGLAMFICASNPLRAEPTLGDAPRAPADVSGLPGGGPHPKSVTGAFSVDNNSREQVRSFYNAVYTSSDGTPIDTTADTSSCTPGTNSTAFQEAVLRRINWFRAMAGVPAAVTFDSGESAEDQQAAIIMSSHNQLQHVGDWTGWSCVTPDGTNAAGNSNLALGYDGPDAITGYIWDFGANNSEVGHRRWILFPQTQVMGTGDVPQENSLEPANATWVFDANLHGPRPTTRTPYVSWPPAGYVPYQVVYPQWSFALSNADVTAATVSMTSNGVPVGVTIQPYQAGFGENTLVWYPTSLDPTLSSTTFPFGGADTVYTVTVSNVVTGAGTESFTYNVTVFDPSVPGADYFPPTISGSSQPSVNAGNPYACTAITNATGYQWLVAQSTNGDLIDNAQNGLVNFIISPTPSYSIITNAVDGSGNCFHLTHGNPTAGPQLLQLKETLFPRSNSVVSFKSLLGYATTDETARLQASSDGGSSWKDVFTESGCNDGASTNQTQCESTFTAHSFSLSSYAGQPTLLRFNFDYQTGYYYPNQSANYIGWSIENVVVTNAQQMINSTTNATASTNFTFTPTLATNYNLFARALIFTEFPLGWGPVDQVTAVVGSPIITLSAPAISGGQVQLNFAASGTASTFELLQADQLPGPWTTNAGAVFTTNVPGSSYRFTATGGAATRFYRIQSP